jgi:hypothetical protein
MSHDENVLETSDDSRFRVRLEPDPYPDEPYDDGQSPLLRLDYRRGWQAEHVMATGRPTDDDDRIEEAAARWGSNFTLLEKYLRAYYGMTAIETWHSGDYWYVTYDTAKWREHVGAPEGSVDMSEYKAWCEGDCWFYVVEENVTWQRTDNPDVTMGTWEHVDSCGGFYGSEYAGQCAREALKDTAEAAKPVSLASCGHPANEDGECDCMWWPERAPITAERLAAAVKDMERFSRSLAADREKQE